MYENRTVWHGGNGLKAIDRFTGGSVDHLVISASEPEHAHYSELANQVEHTLGKRPLGMSADKALSYDSIFEYNTRRGIASAIAWRKTPGHHDREAWDTDKYDRHGIPRCQHCGAPGDVDAPGLGLYFARSQPRLRFRCRLGHTPECDQTQSIACSENWRLLIPLSRLTTTYHALSREGKHSEHVHRHTRQRYGAGGKDYTGRVKRRNMVATQLRLDASRVIECSAFSCAKAGSAPAGEIIRSRGPAGPDGAWPPPAAPAAAIVSTARTARRHSVSGSHARPLHPEPLRPQTANQAVGAGAHFDHQQSRPLAMTPAYEPVIAVAR